MTHLGTLVPAYGRVYTSLPEIVRDLANGLDFNLHSFDGAGYVNFEQLNTLTDGEWSAQVRYGNGLRKTAIVYRKVIEKAARKMGR